VKDEKKCPCCGEQGRGENEITATKRLMRNALNLSPVAQAKKDVRQ